MASQPCPILQAHVTLPPARVPFLEQDGVWPSGAVQFQALRCLEASAPAPLETHHHVKKFQCPHWRAKPPGQSHCQMPDKEGTRRSSQPPVSRTPSGGIRHTSDTMWTLRPQQNRPAQPAWSRGAPRLPSVESRARVIAVALGAERGGRRRLVRVSAKTSPERSDEEMTPTGKRNL